MMVLIMQVLGQTLDLVTNIKSANMY